MASTDSTVVPPGGLVLVTGVNGFIGSYVASGLLGLGYRVRGTLRSADKVGWITQAMAARHPKAHFETAIVPDQSVPGAWTEAMRGVDGIAHVAGDMTFGPDPEKIITPLLASIRKLLEAANAPESQVKRFVLTSSNQAALNRTTGKAFEVTKTMWNEAAVERAWRPPPYEAERGWDVYSALKTQTEQEMWKFARETHPKFVVNSVLPPYSTGAIFAAEQHGSTARLVLDLYKKPQDSAFMREFGASYVCHVEDVARLHIAALTQDDVRDERLLAFAHPINFNDWLAVFRKISPEREWPEDDPKQERDLTYIDGKTELALLKRFGQTGWTSFEDTVRKICLESP